MLEENYEQNANFKQGKSKMLTSNKESLNGNPSDNTSNPANPPNDTNVGKGYNIQSTEDDLARVVIIIPKSHQGGSPSSENGAIGLNEKTREEDASLMSKMEMLEEKMRAIQGIEAYRRLDIQDFCLFPNIEIPANFKVPVLKSLKEKQIPWSIWPFTL